MENLTEKLREKAIRINSYKNKNIENNEFIIEFCEFLQEFNLLQEINIDNALEILWYFVHEQTFEDKNLSKHKILSLISDLNCKNNFIEFYHILGKVYEAVQRLNNN